MEEFAECFVSSSLDRDAKLGIEEAIGYYLAANDRFSSEPHRLVSTAIALESLSYQILVASNTIDGSSFEKLRAADLLALSLRFANIDIAIPQCFGSLISVATGFASWTNGPAAVTETRNAIVHTSAKLRRKLQSIGEMGVLQARQLACHYARMLILHELDYCGEVGDPYGISNTRMRQST